MGTTLDEGLAKLWKGLEPPERLHEYPFYYPTLPYLDYMYVGEWLTTDGKISLRKTAYLREEGGWSNEARNEDNGGFLPIWNAMHAWKLPAGGTVIVTATEHESELLAGFYREDATTYAPICPYPEDEKRQLNLAMFSGKRVVFWPKNNEPGQLWMARFYDAVSEVAAEVLVADREGYGTEFNAAALLESTDPVVRMKTQWCVQGAKPWTVAMPVIDQKNGFSSMRGYIPKVFVKKVRADLKDEDGKVPGDYATIMRLAAVDRAFDNFVKIDRATGLMLFHECYHNSYDEADNDLLVRLNRYGMARPSKELRYDVIKTLSLREAAVINSTHAAMHTNKGNYPNPVNRLETILSKVRFEVSSPKDQGFIFELWDTFFRRAALHTYKAFTDEPFPNDIVPILIGAQGIGKSRLVRYLSLSAPLFQDLGDKTVSLGTPDAIRMIAGKLIVELAELSVFNRTEMSVAKAFISQTVDEFRQLYERSITRVPRTASLIGTTNESEFLKDRTGNRRFFPMRVLEVDYQWLFDHHQLIEETWAYYWNEAIAHPNQWYDLAAPVKKHFMELTELALDTPAEADFMSQCIMELERDLWSLHITSPKRNVTQLTMTPPALALKMIARGFSIPRNFRSHMTSILASMGYEAKPVRENGVLMRALAILYEDPRLKARVGANAEPPRF